MPAAAFSAKKAKRMTDEEYAAALQPSTNKDYKYMKPLISGSEDEVHGPWNKFGRVTADGSDVDSLFVSNSELMDNQPRVITPWSTGMSAGYSGDSNRTTIINEIGGRQVSSVVLASENRLDQLDDDGEYIGRNLGQIKKAVLDEYTQRSVKRKAEKEEVRGIMDEWASLSPEEQDARKQAAIRNMKSVHDTVAIEEIEEIPEQYLFAQLSLQPINPESDSQTQLDSQEQHTYLNVSDIPTESTERPRKRFLTLATSTNRLSRQDVDRLEPNFRNRSSIYSPSPSNVSSAGGSAPTESSSSSPNLSSHGRQWRPPKSKHRHGRSRPRLSHPLPQPPPQWTIPKDLSFFPVTNVNPAITPLADIEQSLSVGNNLNNDLVLKLGDLTLECETKPRVVVIKLHPTVKYTAELLLGRIRGARLQEIQFFPEEHEALLVFIYPHEAQAFIDHFQYARKASDQELRRLQLSVVWFKDANLTDAVHAPQKGLLELILSKNASRAIKVDHIPTNMNKEMIESYFKEQFSDLCSLRLVRPTKNYLKERGYSTFALLDFRSVFHASEARQRFDTGSVQYFEQSRSEWLTDPCAKPHEQAPWCKCYFCADITQAPLTTKSHPGLLSGRNRDQLKMAMENVEYDIEADLQRPETFIRKSDAGPMPMERS